MNASEKIRVVCQACGAQFDVGMNMAGKSARCKCGAIIKIPATSLDISLEALPPTEPVQDAHQAADPNQVVMQRPTYAQKPDPNNPNAPRSKKRIVKRIKPKKKVDWSQHTELFVVLALIGFVSICGFMVGGLNSFWMALGISTFAFGGPYIWRNSGWHG